MNLIIKRLDPALPLPTYKTPGAVAFDLCSRIDAEIAPHELKLIPLNVIIKPPKGYFLLMAVRSSSPIKKGIMCANSVGLFDEDFCGENDEWQLEAYNFTNQTINIQRGERIAQAMLIKFERAEFHEVTSMSDNARGGLGSTG